MELFYTILYPTYQKVRTGGGPHRLPCCDYRVAGATMKSQMMEKIMSQAVFYHAGCSVCLEAESKVAEALDKGKYEVEIVHLGEAKHRVSEAERVGVKSVPALVLDGVPFHINFGADLSALK